LHGRTSRISRGVSQGLLLALASLALFSLRSIGQDNAKKVEVPPMEAVLQLHLPHRDGIASMYYSACCTERAVEIQKSLQDMIAFYREKLGVAIPLRWRYWMGTTGIASCSGQRRSVFRMD
jgi:hypothetical protein